MTGAEGNLFCLGKKFIHVAVQLQFANDTERDKILWPNLRGIQNVKIKIILVLFRDNLYGKVPFGVSLIVNGLHQVFAMEVRILAPELQGLVPDQRMHAQMGDPVEFDEMALSLLVDKRICVDSKALHHAIGPWNRPVRHGPHEEMRGFWMKVHKIPKIVVCSLRLRDLILRLWLDSMDYHRLVIPSDQTNKSYKLTKIREFNGFLDRENRDVVPNKIPISFVRVELGCKAPNITDSISASLTPLDRGKAHKDGSVS